MSDLTVFVGGGTSNDFQSLSLCCGLCAADEIIVCRFFCVVQNPSSPSISYKILSISYKILSISYKILSIKDWMLFYQLQCAKEKNDSERLY